MAVESPRLRNIKTTKGRTAGQESQEPACSYYIYAEWSAHSRSAGGDTALATHRQRHNILISAAATCGGA